LVKHLKLSVFMIESRYGNLSRGSYGDEIYIDYGLLRYKGYPIEDPTRNGSEMQSNDCWVAVFFVH